MDFGENCGFQKKKLMCLPWFLSPEGKLFVCFTTFKPKSAVFTQKTAVFRSKTAVVLAKTGNFGKNRGFWRD